MKKRFAPRYQRENPLKENQALLQEQLNPRYQREYPLPKK